VRVVAPTGGGGAGDPLLLCFAACRAATPQRCEALRRSLISLARQSQPLAAVALSWHAPTSQLRRAVAEALGAARAEGLLVVDVEQASSCSQFEHLRALAHSREVEDLVVGRSAWVLFSDDDDLSHPNRAKAFAAAAGQIDGDAGAELVLCSVHCRLRQGASAPETLGLGDVEALRSRGDVEVLGFDSPGSPEIFNHCVRLGALRRFIDSTNEVLLRHRFCDVRFASYCQHKLRGSSFVPADRQEWMYFYSNPHAGPRHAVTEAGELEHPEDNERASLALETEEEDRRRAGTAHGRLMAIEEGLLTPEQVVCTIASMRQNLELVLIMHSIQGALPRQSVEDVAGQTAANFLGGVPGRSLSAPLQQWAVSLASDLARDTCERFGIAVA